MKDEILEVSDFTLHGFLLSLSGWLEWAVRSSIVLGIAAGIVLFRVNFLDESVSADFSPTPIIKYKSVNK